MEAQFMYEKNINIIMGNQIATSYVRKRDCYNQLKGFMQHEYPGKICALYGNVFNSERRYVKKNRIYLTVLLKFHPKDDYYCTFAGNES